MSNQENTILSLIKEIDKGMENIDIGVDPNDTIPLEIPPKDSIYYRTYVNDAVYWDLSSGSSGTSGDSGIDILNQWINGSGTVTINDLKEVLGNSPSAQVGVINELITEIALPDDITYLPYISPNLKKVYANNIEDVDVENKQSLLAQLSEDGPLKCGKVLFGWKGEIPEVITADVTQGITSISDYCFASSEVGIVELNDSVEKVGYNAFLNTPFMDNYTEGPAVYLGKTLYGINSKFDIVDELHILEGIEYVWLTNNIVSDNASAACGLIYLPLSLKEGRIGNIFIDNIVFPKELPTHYDYDTSSGTLLGSVYTIMYNGTIADFEELLSIVGTDWLNTSSLKVIICTDGVYPISNNLIYHTPIDSSEVEDSVNGVYYGEDLNIFECNSSVKTIKVCGWGENPLDLYSCYSLEVIDLSEYTNYVTPQIYDNPALTTLILPDTITEFYPPGPYFVEGCPLLTSITYNGTQELWESVYKYGDDWYTRTNVKQVICSDGIIEIQ